LHRVMIVLKVEVAEFAKYNILSIESYFIFIEQNASLI